MKLDQQLLARLKRGDDPGDVIQQHLDDQGDPDYLDTLEPLCQKAGWPDENCTPQLSVNDWKITPAGLEVSVQAYFDEKMFPSGCPDMPDIYPREGVVPLIVDMDTGELIWGCPR